MSIVPLVQCGTEAAKTMCNLCDLLQLVKRIIDFITFQFTPVFGGILIVVAGFFILLGGTSPERVTEGKKILTNTVIGVIIVFVSFMVTNFILQTIAGEKPIDALTNWSTLTCSQEKGFSDEPMPTPSEGPTPLPTETDYVGAFADKDSPELDELILCMQEALAKDVPATDWTIVRPTTDSRIGRGLCQPIPATPPEKFNNENQCIHEANSCHYGGTNPACQQRGSYAMDIVSNNGRTAGYNKLISVAKEKCGATFARFEPGGVGGSTGDHVHVSIGAKYDCGCN